jgi:hypothetical protein
MRDGPLLLIKAMFQVPSELRESLHLSIVLAEDPSSKGLKFVPVRAEIIREMKVVIFSLRVLIIQSYRY